MYLWKIKGNKCWSWKYLAAAKSLQLCPSLRPHELYSPWSSPGQNIGVGSCSLLQGILPTQGSNLGLPHCRQILYLLSHQGRPRILEGVACSFSSRSSQPRNRTGVSCIADRRFTVWATREAHITLQHGFACFLRMRSKLNILVIHFGENTTWCFLWIVLIVPATMFYVS